MPNEVKVLTSAEVAQIWAKNYAHQPIQPVEVDNLCASHDALERERDEARNEASAWASKSLDFAGAANARIAELEREKSELLREQSTRADWCSTHLGRLRDQISDLTAQLADARKDKDRLNLRIYGHLQEIRSLKKVRALPDGTVQSDAQLAYAQKEVDRLSDLFLCAETITPDGELGVTPTTVRRELKRLHDGFEAQLAEWAKAIAEAPHEMLCQTQPCSGRPGAPCDCWKSRVLAALPSAPIPDFDPALPVGSKIG